MPTTIHLPVDHPPPSPASPPAVSRPVQRRFAALCLVMVCLGVPPLVAGAIRLAEQTGQPIERMVSLVLMVGIAGMGGFALLVAHRIAAVDRGANPASLVLASLAAGGLWMVVFAVAATVLPWTAPDSLGRGDIAGAVAELLRGVGAIIHTLAPIGGLHWADLAPLRAIALLGLVAASGTTLAVMAVGLLLWRLDFRRLGLLMTPALLLMSLWCAAWVVGPAPRVTLVPPAQMR